MNKRGYNTQNQNQNQFQNKLQKENNFNNFQTHLIFKNNKNNQNNSQKERNSISNYKSNKIIYNDKKNDFNLLSPIKNSNYNSNSNNIDNDNDYNNDAMKLKEEIIEFKKIENKIIKNFIDLSETQISGVSVRDWLYENRNLD